MRQLDDCMVCGIWRCRDCGKMKDGQLRGRGQDYCRKCGSANGTWRSVQHRSAAPHHAIRVRA